MPHRLKIQKPPAVVRRGLQRAAASLICWFLLIYLAFYFRTCTYLVRQASGQFMILLQSQSPDEGGILSERARRNLALVPKLKKYTVDSLGFDPTNNYEKIFYHGQQPVIWVVTASKAFSLEPVQWQFPVVGTVSYKGYFDKRLATLEFDALRRKGLDADISPVTAYSTLGWFPDPIFSAMLERSKGSFCNLIVHELFHATYYESGKVNLNENLASFIAHKATLRFLGRDTLALNAYLRLHHDQQLIRGFLKRQATRLGDVYLRHSGSKVLPRLKEELIAEMADSVRLLPVLDSSRARLRSRHILAARNAYFVGYLQYESLQDSLEFVFNKFYRRNIKNMVHDLKRRQAITIFD